MCLGPRVPATKLLKMAKAVPKGPKCPQNEPKPGTKVCLCKATLSPCLSREVEGLVGWGGVGWGGVGGGLGLGGNQPHVKTAHFKQLGPNTQS